MSGINGEYAQRTDRTNIIGDGRAWHEPDPGRFREKPPPAYEGDEPFVYVCYSHDDARTVMSEIAWLTQKGVHIWYDEGIPAGSRWSDELAARIRRSSAFLYFISDRSTVSNHCINEVNFVSDLDKPTIAVYLQETALPPAVQLILSTTHALNRYSLDPDTYRAQLIKVLDERNDPEPRSKRFPMRSLSPRQRERVTWSLALLVLISAIVYLSRIIPDAPERPVQ